MTDLELRKKASAIISQFRDETIPDEAILLQIQETPELIHIECPSSANLFLDAVHWNRFAIAKKLREMGADVNWRCRGSAISGNALNVAHTPQEAEELLAMGVEIERNLLPSGQYKNPALMAVSRNKPPMLLYWLAKQKELFAAEQEYINELLRAVIFWASIINQPGMLACIIADDELFQILKGVYAEEDSMESIRLALGSLRQIRDESLEPRKKELRKVLNTRKKELAAI